MTLDGKIVVSHDPSGERMAGVPSQIKDCTLTEVRTWNMGAGFEGANGVFRIPTLAVVLAEFPDVVINVDLKQKRPTIVATVVDLIRRHQAQERVIVASFHHRILLHVRLSKYAGVTALGPAEFAVAAFGPAALSARLPLLGSAAQIPTSQGPVRFDSKKVIARLHKLGIRVDFWTINDPVEAKRLITLGADGIMTDDPRTMVAALR
jgi:glycerophosphoryl diester phosphodiesterase